MLGRDRARPCACGVQWVGMAMDPVHKLLLVAQVGPRTREMACWVVHALSQLLAPGCVPAFSSDSLMHYFTALTAHWGSWQVQAQGKRVWRVAANLVYAQVVKQYRRHKLAQVVRRLLLGTSCVGGSAATPSGPPPACGRRTGARRGRASASTPPLSSD